jgi:hypothetical protein
VPAGRGPRAVGGGGAAQAGHGLFDRRAAAGGAGEHDRQEVAGRRGGVGDGPVRPPAGRRAKAAGGGHDDGHRPHPLHQRLEVVPLSEAAQVRIPGRMPVVGPAAVHGLRQRGDGIVGAGEAGERAGPVVVEVGRPRMALAERRESLQQLAGDRGSGGRIGVVGGRLRPLHVVVDPAEQFGVALLLGGGPRGVGPFADRPQRVGIGFEVEIADVLVHHLPVEEGQAVDRGHGGDDLRQPPVADVAPNIDGRGNVAGVGDDVDLAGQAAVGDRPQHRGQDLLAKVVHRHPLPVREARDLDDVAARDAAEFRVLGGDRPGVGAVGIDHDGHVLGCDAGPGPGGRHRGDDECRDERPSAAHLRSPMGRPPAALRARCRTAVRSCRR